MLKPSPFCILSGILAGITLLLIAAWLSGSTAQICEYNQSTHQNNCATYSLVSYFFIESGSVLNYYGALITALATVAIAGFTYTLKRSTDRLWEAGKKQLEHAKNEAMTAAFNRIGEAARLNEQVNIARQSAEAAKQAADAAVAAERARFYVVLDHNFLECINRAAAWDGPIDQEERPLPMDAQPMAGIRFKNYGKTPGIVIEVTTGIAYSETAPDPVWDVKVVNENIIAADELTEKFGTIINGQMTMAQAKKVRSGGGNIWVFGSVDYDDVFGERQTHRFFQRLVRVSQFRYVLQAYDYKHYNRST
jgi:hypothetical protein